VEIEVNLSRLRDESDQHLALVVARDVSERRRAEADRARMEAQLREAQRLESMGRLAAGVAHELKTPMQFIGSNTQFLQDAFELLAPRMQKLLKRQPTGEGPTQVAFLLGEIPAALAENQEGVRRISRIVQAMQELSHGGKAEPGPTDLNHQIEVALAVAMSEWKYVARMDAQLEAGLPRVRCQPHEFQQILLNLLINGAQAIEARFGREGGVQGQLKVVTRVREGRVEVAISDNGGGIPESLRGRIFEPFFTTKPLGQGTGQGLSIVQELVERMEGNLEWESVPGEGSTFRVLLPFIHPEEPA
jgi:signal transduction histidine kinase